MSELDFVPRWASPPGDTVKQLLIERQVDQADTAAALNLAPGGFDDLLAGRSPITIRLAERLAVVLGGSVEFWMARDGQYHEDRSRVDADEWAQQLPVKEMAALGWISRRPAGWLERIEACLDFFDVASVDAWRAVQEVSVSRTRFRSSRKFDRDEFAVAAWLRQCQVELSAVRCSTWDRGAFAALLPELLPLTRERDPAEFLATLRTRCAAVGVAVALVRAPTGCYVSGAALPREDGQPSIALSGRYRSDDHLWFTFFHEAAHLLLHGVNSVYLDEIERETRPETADELEADRFAGALLVPPEYEERVYSARTSPFKIGAIAREIGVSEGVVVGYLQHRGTLSFGSRLNKLKRRYEWDGPSLEMA